MLNVWSASIAVVPLVVIILSPRLMNVYPYAFGALNMTTTESFPDFADGDQITFGSVQVDPLTTTT
ncbi:MAG: hypothetical protein ABIG42_05140, partial [bacterium]